MENGRDIEDVVRALGYLCLGSRFKRIGEQLQAGTQVILAELGPVAPGQYPILAAIDRMGPLTVGEMAQAMGLSQPGVTRNLLQLTELGMIEMNPSPTDRRIRVASLSQAGRDLVSRAKAGGWAAVEAAVADLCRDLDGPLLDQLSAIEDRLAALPLHKRGGHEPSA
jgi:DNA-binding MarR family transcriptional regulator